MTATYYKYWGKAGKAEEGKPIHYHFLPYHCMDVAAVGWILLENNVSLRQRLAAITGIDEKICCRLLPLFLVLHDFGKFSETFQNLRPDLVAKLHGTQSTRHYAVRHDCLGNLLWRDHLLDTLNSSEIPAFSEIGQGLDDWQEIINVIINTSTGHHGKPPELHGPNNIRLHLANYFGGADLLAADEFIRDICTIFPLWGEHVAALPEPFDIEERVQKASWLIAGFVVLCDWIGSNSEWFAFRETPMPLVNYWQNHALPQAKKAFVAAGIGKSETACADMTFARLFPAISQPTPLQSHVADCFIANDPQLFILEDVTGSGKTEAALLLAGRLMAAGRGSGLFMALPTMATSNAMYERMTKVYRLLFADGATPSLVLSHAARHLSATFMASVFGPGKNIADDETITAQCSAWLADNRKKALLADVGVGTIDQALLAVLPARYQSLRLFGLAGHILIIDEVHAYDPYMNKLLQNLLAFHAALGGSAILLSATLPRHTRQELLAAFARGCEEQNTPQADSGDYPLITAYSRETGLTETAIEATPQRRCSVAVRLIPEQNEVERLIVEAARQGRCVCWIRNTVHDALAGYERLKEQMDAEKLRLFHARFAMGDRLEIESAVVETFGRRSGERQRSGKVLIATQVVEQSLDLDFDLLVSDLAPMDLLIQRAGRLHRHPRDERGNPLSEGPDRRNLPEMIIHGPLPDENVSGEWYKSVFPKAAFVYPSHGCLWLTARLLKDKTMKMPDDARELIEAAFSEHADSIPEPLRQRDQNADAQWQADRSLAHINMLKLEEGYTATINQWREDMKTPTRLGGMETTVRLARWDGKTLVPWYNHGDFPWDMSQVNLRGNLVNAEVEHDDPALAASVAELKERLQDKGKWSVLVPLSQAADGRWQGMALNKQNMTMIVEYDRLTGVVVNKKEGIDAV